MQSPKFSAAGWRPRPKRRYALRCEDDRRLGRRRRADADRLGAVDGVGQAFPAGLAQHQRHDRARVDDHTPASS
jgi:hypothetical protein